MSISPGIATTSWALTAVALEVVLELAPGLLLLLPEQALTASAAAAKSATTPALTGLAWFINVCLCHS